MSINNYRTLWLFELMTLVFTSYVKSPEFNNPQEWLRRISPYIGILNALAVSHTVISFERISYTGEYSERGVSYKFVEQNRKITFLPFKTHARIKKLQPDVVFVNGLIFPVQTIMLRLKLGRKAKIIAIHHAEKPFNGLKRYLQIWADKCITGYFFASEELAQQWVNNGNLKQIEKANEIMEVSSSFLPVNKELAKKKINISGPLDYLWVGRLNGNKDPITVIKAFINFRHIQPSARLYMIFQNEDLLEQVKLEIAKNEVSGQGIILVGKVPHEELVYWYSGADFIISGSHYEGSGAAVCEGMSCGCIPILTNIPSFRMMTRRGTCGLLYEPGNHQHLFTMLQKSLELNIAEERKKVLTQFKEHLSFEAIANKIQNVIFSLK